MLQAVLVALVVTELFTYTTNMWAIVDNNNIVFDYIIGVSFEKAQLAANGNTLIEMTLDNSPAYIGAYWNGQKFI
jgi:hypothetical protein